MIRKAKGAVAAGHVETGRAATTVLSEGGNAVDAALAAMCAACVAEPILASLGGGGFLMVDKIGEGAKSRPQLFDFFVQTPNRRRRDGIGSTQSILADFGTTCQEFHIGLGSVAVPGAVKGLFEIHERLGRMPLKEVVAPAIQLAREGTTVNADQAAIIRIVGAILLSAPTSRALFINPDRPDELIGEGFLLKMPEFADALEILAIEGQDLFYRGEMAASIVEDCQHRGGHLTRDDLARYQVERRTPVTVEALGVRLALNPPPAVGGLVVGLAARLLDPGLGPRLRFGSAEHMRLLASTLFRTSREAIAREIETLEANDLHRNGAGGASSLDRRLLARYREDILGLPEIARGTTHISVIDGQGMAASLTVSNGEGSAYAVPGTGIFLNNMLGEDDVNPEGVDNWPTGVRLSSMMSPLIAVEPGGTLTAAGSGGSKRIRSAMAQALYNLFVLGMPLDEAVCAPRLHVEERKLSLEPGFPEDAAAILEPDFDEVEVWEASSMFFGGVQIARREGNGAVAAAGDPRRGGVGAVV